MPGLSQVLRQQHVLNSSPLDMMGEYKVNSAAICTFKPLHVSATVCHIQCFWR